MGKDAFRPWSRPETSREVLFGYSLNAWVSRALAAPRTCDSGVVKIVFQGHADRSWSEALPREIDIPRWQIEAAKGRHDEILTLVSTQGPLWLLQPQDPSRVGSHGGLLDQSPYAKARDLAGAIVGAVCNANPRQVDLYAEGASPEQRLGLLVGLELGAYRYLKARFGSGRDNSLPQLVVSGFAPGELDAAGALGVAINSARHLVNLPANELDPRTYAEAIQQLFAGSSTVAVEVWDEVRLAAERMGLLLAVGQGAQNPPRLVHLAYRPANAGSRRPIAFVGKGITFDTGGLNIKAGDFMRHMKKDMAGSAAIVGLALWLERSALEQPVDLYLALAENAVGPKSFRPGDVILARNGDAIEIHNTDAEGRLVLADALAVAASRQGGDEPQLLIDVATLTGAARVALGPRLAALFANDDTLADGLLEAGYEAGDLCWRMPLLAEYGDYLKSNVAHVTNATATRHAGAITAALFLSRFVREKPWAHFDIYAWADNPAGPWQETGGNGQSVQCLARFLSTYALG